MSQEWVSNSHSLVEIPPCEWKLLLNLYSGWRRRLEPTGYNAIANYIQWKGIEPELDVKFFSLDGEWNGMNDGTFIIIANNGPKKKAIFFNTLSQNLDRLTNALFCLSSLLSPEEYSLYGYGEGLAPAVDVYSRKVENSKRHPVKTNWYRASKEIVATFSIEPPTGIRLRPLAIEDASTINEIWPHREEGSVEFVKRLIDYNLSVGACDSNGKLIAWCLRLPLGSLGLLQVVESHKRLGLGGLLVRYMSKKISELDEEVLADVLIENTPSNNMFAKLGFQKIDHAYWIF